ncbi:hypothetical protein OG21DRAFT_1176146 [Imleria badia]|nr:hypothetical protein OG21DRAFT_1176146 [Imleria badia]
MCWLMVEEFWLPEKSTLLRAKRTTASHHPKRGRVLRVSISGRSGAWTGTCANTASDLLPLRHQLDRRGRQATATVKISTACMLPSAKGGTPRLVDSEQLPKGRQSFQNISSNTICSGIGGTAKGLRTEMVDVLNVNELFTGTNLKVPARCAMHRYHYGLYRIATSTFSITSIVSRTT